MPSTRNDPDGDFGHVPRLIDPDAPVVRPRPPEPDRRPLTSTQKNHRARRVEEEHARQKERGTFPDQDALTNMSPKQKEESLAAIQAIKASRRIVDEAGVQDPAGEQMSLDDVDPGELDPGRPF